MWRSDADAIRTALTRAGWVHASKPTDRVGTRYLLDGIELELTFVELDDRGRVVIPFPDSPVVWSDEPFGSDRPSLGAVSCRAIPLALLVTGKATPREDAANAAKDRADAEALRHLGPGAG